MPNSDSCRHSPITPAFWILLTMFAVGLVWYGLTQQTSNNRNPPAPKKAPTAQSQISNDPVTTKEASDKRLNQLADGSVEFLPAIEISRRIHSANTPKDSLHEIQALLGTYRFAFGENPVGVENFEITEQLLGKNPKQVVFIAADSSALRGNELVDQWDTPYFFHAVSGQQMDIRSAGPDTTFWTSDDIELTQ